MEPHRLLLTSHTQAQFYLKSRARVVRPSSVQPDLRTQLLKDRAAAFWICVNARAHRGPLLPWMVLAPRGEALPRIHCLQGPGVGMALSRHGELRQRLCFCIQALNEHGGLWLPWPLEKHAVDQVFGQGAWAEMALTHSLEQASQLNQVLNNAGQTIARRRL